MGLLYEIARRARQNPYHISEDILFRWSPKVMNGQALTVDDLLPLFDAARWAPSGRNRQEWRFFYALREDKNFDILFNLLSENNQRWCKEAGSLLVLVSRKISEEGHFIRSHSLDTGMAFQNCAIEATRRDLVIHPLGAFNRAKVEALLNLGDDFEVEIMIAVGKPGSRDAMATDREISQRNSPETFTFRLDSMDQD